MRRHTIYAAAACFLAVVLAAPAQASAHTGSVDRHAAQASSHRGLVAVARVVGHHRVRISGHAQTPSGGVTIQRKTSDGWRNVGRTAIHRHRFVHHLRQSVPVAVYRVQDPQGTSPSVRVRAARVVAALPKKPASSPTSASTNGSAATAAVDACGQRPAKADGSLWSCTFDDEFNGNKLDRTKWLPQTVFKTGDPDTFACYRDDPSNISESSGTLNLTVRHEAAPVACPGYPGVTSSYTGGMVTTYHLFSQQYGRFEARMKSPTYSGPGLQDDFWLWPDDRVPSTAVWPYAGEMDVVEHYSSYSHLDIPFLHYWADAYGNLPGINTAWTCGIKPGEFNTYTLTWGPTRIEIDVNGTPCLINTSGDSAFQKPYIMALTQALGVGANGLDASTPLPATLQVDYVRVWS